MEILKKLPWGQRAEKVRKVVEFFQGLLASRKMHWIILGVILLIFLVLKLQYNPYPVGEFARDGAYYYQVARHISEGDGLLTSIAIYNQGFKELPHPTPIYPLWPLFLGGVGAVIGLKVAASLVPEFLFFVSLIFLYVLTNTVANSLGERSWFVFGIPGPIDMGHLAVMLLGFNRVFFKYT